ncbi:hypothetical protein F4859DRAFT_510079 [Xylaria cf. heliscus]|nr:hypothetical protein F4859DRAFT_510079 [Xylaria cf. heliscus]
MPELTVGAKTIGGYHVPAKTAVTFDIRRLNNDPVAWGSNCHEWDPDRFLRVAPKDLRYGVGVASSRYLEENAADIIFKLTIMAIIEELSLEPVGDEEKPKTKDLNILRL